MEHISHTLAKLQPNIHQQKNSTNEVLEEPVEDTVLTKLKRFNISSLEHTFEKFKANEQTTQAKQVLELVSNDESGKRFIMLYGATGCGKTHLIEATIINWASRGLFARYYTFSEIARQLKSAIRTPERYEQVFNIFCGAERLIVDDYGMGSMESRFEVADLEDIIDSRYRKRYYPNLKLVTIMATNKDIKELPDRIVSRFCDPEFGVVIYMGDKDYRRRKR